MSTKVIKRNSDRLSNLPDPIIYHILSLMNTKYSVQTCVLSKKWSHHWTHIHSLNFDFNSFSKRVAFGKFVLHVLHNRKSFNLHRLNFHCGYSSKPPPYIKKIFQYAVSHSVEELETDLGDFPPCFYGCQTLVTLNLHSFHINIDRICSFGFGSLSTLKLSQLCLSSKNNNHDLFSDYLNLKNLIVERCSTSSASENFTIVSSSVVYLKISSSLSDSNYRTIVISAPRLELFDLKVTSNVELRIYKCPLLRKMNLRIKPPVLAWKESIDWKQEYFWELICMAGGYYNSKPVRLLSFNFSKGKFISYQISAHTTTTVSEMDKVEIKRLWFFDGEMVWQSSPDKPRRATESVHGFSTELGFGKVFQGLLI
ncbi:hypothetical protein LWI29_024316 [Acer saccharum]|uniref:F-box domain-containing protein n=1 Tax=Acer saccharum TaxID=4024 RepID=A0AA39SJX9_ACESA|nr:hypothetical protein LWI29_024316 [Acer saccharum]